MRVDHCISMRLSRMLWTKRNAHGQGGMVLQQDQVTHFDFVAVPARQVQRLRGVLHKLSHWDRKLLAFGVVTRLQRGSLDTDRFASSESLGLVKRWKVRLVQGALVHF